MLFSTSKWTSSSSLFTQTILRMRFNGETEFRKRIVFFPSISRGVSSFNRKSLKALFLFSATTTKKRFSLINQKQHSINQFQTVFWLSCCSHLWRGKKGRENEVLCVFPSSSSQKMFFFSVYGTKSEWTSEKMRFSLLLVSVCMCVCACKFDCFLPRRKHKKRVHIAKVWQNFSIFKRLLFLIQLGDKEEGMDKNDIRLLVVF